MNIRREGDRVIVYNASIPRFPLPDSSFTSSEDLPVAFSWRNPSDVKARFPKRSFPNGDASSYLCKPVDQDQCGMCWAISSVQAFSDRYAIANNLANVPMSVLYVLTCTYHENDNVNGCDNGDAKYAVAFLASNGTCTENDLPFRSWYCQFCDRKCGDCDGDQRRMNDKLPKCPGNQVKLYKAEDGVQVRGGNEAIAKEVYFNGPVVVAYANGHDWDNGSDHGWWKETGGVYCNVWDKEFFPYGKFDPDKDGSNSPIFDLPERGGGYGHQVVIVGFGKQTITWPVGSIKGKSLDLDYWIIRNSYGANWGPNRDGFAKVAWTTFISTGSGSAGFHINEHIGFIEQAFVNHFSPSPEPPSGNPDHPSGPSKSWFLDLIRKPWFVIGLFGFGFLSICIALLLIVLRLVK